MIRIVIVDDQPVVRQGLRMILESEEDMEVVGEAPDGSSGVEVVTGLHPDVVLMDISMPSLDGIEATRRLLSSGNPPYVLMLTTYGVDENVYDALQAGASGFLVKTDPPEHLVAAIRAVIRGEATLAPEITGRLIERFLSAPHPTRPPAQYEELTAREREVLLLLGKGRSNAEIALELVVSEGTVKTHVAHILSKLNLRDRTQAVVYVHENGIIPPDRR